MRVKLVVALGLGLYTLLSATDWLMTFALLRGHPGAVEVNPVAGACLEHSGWYGLAIFKTCGVLIFTGAVLLLARRRPRVAVGVVAFGCAILLGVTTYTHKLICESYQDQREMAEDAAWAKPKPGAKQPGPQLKVPERCWFAEEPPLAIAARK